MERAMLRLTMALGATLWLGVSPAIAAGHTLTICTPSLVPSASGRLDCRVVASSRVRLDITAHIVAEDGTDVTEFGTSFRASPEVTGRGFFAEETAGSFADEARYCRATVTGVQSRNAVRASLTAVDGDGNAGATVESSRPGTQRTGGGCPDGSPRGRPKP
jgi:hypothetical protein